MRTLLFALVLVAGESSSVDLNRWTGTWTWKLPAGAKEKSDRLVIRKSPDTRGALDAVGNAYWYGPMVNYDGKPSEVVHFGFVNADGVPDGDRLALHQGQCEVKLTLTDGEIHASDNMLCGGMNVRFSGAFFRR